MKKSSVIAAGAFAVVLVLLAFAAGRRVFQQAVEPVVVTPPAEIPSSTGSTSTPETYQGFLYGRVTTQSGASYEGRLRWGGGEEAFWGDYFDGFKEENRWAALVPPARLKERHPISIFGFEIAHRERTIVLRRPFVARFGDLSRIEADGLGLRAILKSGTVVDLDRLGADDFADGLRVWDERRGVVDLGELPMRSVELLPTPRLDAVPRRLHGTVRTRHGAFTGHVQWHREDCVGSDELAGRTADGEVRLPFASIRSIARASPDSSLVTLLDGSELVLSGSREVGRGNRGLYVDDRRYGRVLVSWDAFEAVDFSPGDGVADGSGPAYDDFPPGHPLTGTVTTRAGQRLAGRLVYDLDESETTETLDAPFRGVDYRVPFGLIGSLEPPGGDDGGARLATVTLHDGEQLQLEPGGDLGDGNAGLLVFADGDEDPRYVPWAEVERIALDRPPATYPPLGR